MSLKVERVKTEVLRKNLVTSPHSVSGVTRGGGVGHAEPVA